MTLGSDSVGTSGLLPTAVDWKLAARTGSALVRKGPNVSRREGAQVVAELADAAVRAEVPVREVTGLAGGLVIPPARVVDRRRWVEAAAMSLAELTEGDRAESNLLAGKASGVQAGGVLAFLASAVLGQYDPFTGADGTLLLVAPNIVAVERALSVQPGDFRLWVCLHEVTHRVQFSAVPWLADYLRETVAVLTADAAGEPEKPAEVLSRLVGELRGRRDDDSGVAGSPGGVLGLLRAAQSPDRREALDRLLVLGTLLEGHADHVMDAVGPAVVPSVEQIRRAFDHRRKRGSNPINRLLRTLLGMDAKLAQYVRGKAFVDAVVTRVGMTDFNRIWTDPTTLPTLSEIETPHRWTTRVLA